jgi:hypothetical protein
MAAAPEHWPGSVMLRTSFMSASRQDGLTDTELVEVTDWVKRHKNSGLSHCEHFCDYRANRYLRIVNAQGQEAFIVGRQNGRCFADDLWSFTTLAEGDTIAAVLAILEPLY